MFKYFLTIAQSRCKKQQIISINKDKINSAGKISVCVFDKTGTLTEDHLNIATYLPVSFYQGQNGAIKIKFSTEVNDIETLAKLIYEYYKNKKANPENKSPKNEITELFIESLACCQGATKVKDKLIGDPLDVEMFQSTGWELIEDPKDNENYDTNIFTYVRPKEEESLTIKMSNIKDKENFEEEKKNILKNHYELGILKSLILNQSYKECQLLLKIFQKRTIFVFVKVHQKNYLNYVKGKLFLIILMRY